MPTYLQCARGSGPPTRPSAKCRRRESLCQMAVLLILLGAAGCSSVGSQSSQVSGSSFVSSRKTDATDAGSKLSDFVENTLTPSGLYLHDDSYQQKADSALVDFDKIDLTSKFDDQFKKVSSYDTEEDEAVAAFQIASRNQQLQYFIQLPGWYDTSKCAPLNDCSGPAALNEYIQKQLEILTGHSILTPEQADAIRATPYLTPYDRFALDNARSVLSFDQDAFLAAGGDKTKAQCALNPALISYPQSTGYLTSDYLTLIRYWCAQVASIKREQQLPSLKAQLSGGTLFEVLTSRNTALAQQQADQETAATMQKRIDDINDSAKITGTYSTELRSAVTKLQKDLETASPVAKYIGYKTLADKLQGFLSAQVSHNSAPTQTPSSQKSAAQHAETQKPAPQGTGKTPPTTSQAQAFIGLATAGANLADNYSGQGSYSRVNSLLLATAAARHQMQMAKLDADYQADLIKVYDAEVNALSREVTHLYEASQTLRAQTLNDTGYATSPINTNQREIDGLAAWCAAQDEGDIPFRVLQAKEVQLLRARSVKQGQLSAQSYEAIIKPVLAELDAYGKGGITEQTIVQALGFAGVITSISAK